MSRKSGKASYTFDSSKTGYATIFKPYQEIIMKFLWEIGTEGVNSGRIWIETNKVLLKRGESISRASIIFFLQDMFDAGFLEFTMGTGKGGHHRIYAPLYTETEFKEQISKRIIEKLLESFPDEAYNAMIDLIAESVEKK